MKNSIIFAGRILLLTAAVVVLMSVATADTPLPSTQSVKETDGSKKAPTAVSRMRRPLATSALTVIPGMNTLSLAQGQKAAAAAAAGRKLLEAGYLPDAEAQFHYSVQLNDSDPEALAGLAQTLEQEGKGKQAIPVYRYLLYPKKAWGSSMERDPLLRMHLALLLAGDGQWKEAVFVYESTISGVAIGPSYPQLDVHFSPDVTQSALFQAMCHLAMGVVDNGRMEHAHALAEYTAAISEQPNLALAHYCYGHGLQLLGRYTEAHAAFGKAAALDTSGEVKAAAEKSLSRQ